LEVICYTAKGSIKRRNYMKVSQGVAGRAYRMRKTCYVTEIEDGQWKATLMSDLGFTDKELGRFAEERKCYLCVPILGKNDKVLAIISLDAKIPNAFTLRAVQRVEKTAACMEDIL
jgi:putative methionine-R-sulfoxide reductase with GAF domain